MGSGGGMIGSGHGVTRSQNWLLASWAIRLLVGLTITICLGRFLDAEAFGFYAFVGTALLLGQIAMDLGTGVMAVREIALAPQAEGRILQGLLGWRRLMGFACALVVLVAASAATGHRRIVLILVAPLLMTLPWSGLSIVMTVRQEQGRVQVLGVLSQALVLGGCFMLESAGIAGALFALLPCTRELVNTIGTVTLAWRRLGYLPRGRVRGVGLPGFLRLAMFQGLAVLVQTLYFHIDVVFVRMLKGDAELGAYAAAFRPINPLLLLPGALMAPMLPVLARASRDDRPVFLRQVRASGDLLLGLGALGGALGALLAGDLLTLLYDGRYVTGPLAADGALRWLSGAFMLVFATAPFATAVLADGGERKMLRIALAGLLVNALGNALLVPRWGFEGAAVVTVATEFTVFMAIVVESTRRFRCRFGRRTIGALVPAAVAGAVISLLPVSATPRVAIGVAIGIVGAAALVLGPTGRRFRGTLVDV